VADLPPAAAGPRRASPTCAIAYVGRSASIRAAEHGGRQGGRGGGQAAAADSSLVRLRAAEGDLHVTVRASSRTDSRFLQSRVRKKAALTPRSREMRVGRCLEPDVVRGHEPVRGGWSDERPVCRQDPSPPASSTTTSPVKHHRGARKAPTAAARNPTTVHVGLSLSAGGLPAAARRRQGHHRPLPGDVRERSSTSSSAGPDGKSSAEIGCRRAGGLSAPSP